MDTIQVNLNSQEALTLMQLIKLRLEFLASKEQLNSSEQVEYQALRSVTLQLRNGAQTRINR